jgi:hypothetical protein
VESTSEQGHHTIHGFNAGGHIGYGEPTLVFTSLS